jgi:predicted nucleic acid-binding protein
MRKPIWYWDSCILLGLLRKERDKISTLSRLLHQAESGEMLIVFSAWSLLEVLHLGEKVLDEKTEKVIQDFTLRSCFQIRNLDRATAELSRKIIWQQGRLGINITAKDAPHLATAIMISADVLHTYDPTLLSLNLKLKRQDGKDLRIEIPTLDQEPLDLAN